MLQELRRRLRAARQEAGAAPPALPAPPSPLAPAPPPDAAWLEAELAEVAREQPELARSLARLNPHQLTAVLDASPAALVAAQVGSGKTTVLVHKVLALHLLQGVPLEAMAVLTFSRKAAAEVQQRLRELAPAAAAQPGAFWLMGTFHGVAAALLRRALPLEELGLSRAFRVLGAEEREELWQRLIDAHGLTVRYRGKLQRRVEAWGRGQERFGAMRRPDALGELLRLAEEEKRRLDVVDFDDLLDHARLLLPRAGEALRRPEWILLDEFQDTGPEQLELAERLAGPETRWFAVGDPNQGIYSWRGGGAEVFGRFARGRAASALSLPVNYRSTGAILAGARAFLAPGAELVGVREAGEPVEVLDHADAASEAIYLVGRLRQLEREGCPWEEQAVLYRTRAQVRQLVDALRRAGVPCATAPADSPRAEPAAAWLMDLLRAALEDDAVALRAALGDARYGVLPGRLLAGARLLAWGERRGLAGQALVRAYLEERRRRAEAAGDRSAEVALAGALRWARRLGELPRWLEDRRELAPAARAQALEEWLELGAALRPTSSRHAEDLEAARRWLTRWLAAASRRPGPADGALLHVLRQGGRGDALEQAEAPTAGVRVLTLHAAKGLEFRRVFIGGVNEGLIPLASAWRSPGGEAEERRLFYVGLTRARDGLELSWHRQPARPDVRPEPSSFLAELPRDSVRWLDAAALAARAGPVAAPEPGGLQPGEAVRHKRYGAGVVLRIEPERIWVRFAGHGEKGFAPGLCALERALPSDR